LRGTRRGPTEPREKGEQPGPQHGLRVRLTGPVALNDEQFATLEQCQQSAAIADAASLFLRQVLGDQPLPALIERLANVASEPRVASDHRLGRHERAIEPGCRVHCGQLVKRPRRQELDGDGTVAQQPRLVRRGALEMVVGDDPPARRLAHHAAALPAHRLEPPDMGLGERLGGTRIVAQMRVDIVVSAIARSDRRDRAIDLTHRRAEIGYAQGRAYWGQGYMQEALKAVLNHAFEILNLHRIEADVDPRNAASVRTLERLGFQREGYLRERWQVNGEIQDAFYYGLLRPDWDRLNSNSASS